MNRKESEIYESFPKDKWVYDFNEYRLHHSFSEEFIKKAKEMNLVIGDMQGYRLDKLGSWSDELEFNANVDDLLDDFLAQALEQGLYALKGHRNVGGVRASIYNAMPTAGCEALAQFMQEFERSNG